MAMIHDLHNIDKKTTETAPDIQLWELENAIRKARNNKATGENMLPVDLIKPITPSYQKDFLKLFNIIYEKGILPEKLKAVNFVPIPKKSCSQNCLEYRTVALMSHTLKLLYSIINSRIERRFDENLSET